MVRSHVWYLVGPRFEPWHGRSFLSNTKLYCTAKSSWGRIPSQPNSSQFPETSDNVTVCMHSFGDVNFLSKTFPSSMLQWRGLVGQKIYISKNMHLRKISLTENRGNKRFFDSKSGVQFWFWPLFGKMIAAPTVRKTLRRKIFIWALSVVVHSI